jgi:hypothetical protein
MAKECMWIRNFLKEIQQSSAVDDPTVIWCDNQGAIKIATNQCVSERCKHIDLRRLHIRGEITKGSLNVKYVPGTENVADVFTKIIPGPGLSRLRSKVGITPN